MSGTERKGGEKERRRKEGKKEARKQGRKQEGQKIDESTDWWTNV